MGAGLGFHEGERTVQVRAGEDAVADRNGTMMADSIIAGARGFIEKQFMVVLSSVDVDDYAWASVLYGKPGFLRTENGSSVQIQVAAEERDQADPFWSNIEVGTQIGMLFIELGTRRRYRVNGRVSRLDGQGLEVDVGEAYPNCPKYIQRRQLSLQDFAQEPDASTSAMITGGRQLNEAAYTLIRNADTLFVASSHAERGSDASHRGGNPGFIQILEDGTIRVPDYHGNSMFNTLGNMESNPKTGLLIQDFAGNRQLQLVGNAVIRWDVDDQDGATGGTRRYWDFTIERWMLRSVKQGLHWEYVDASPFNPAIAGKPGATS